MGTLLTGGTLIDCTGAPPLPNAAVLVVGERIADVGPRDQVTARNGDGHQVIDLNGGTLLPGLWDAHLHLGGTVPPWSAQFANESETAYACRSVQKAQENLLAGITSARTMTDRFNADLHVKAAIDAGHVVGPRLFVSGDSLWTRTAAGPEEFRRRSGPPSGPASTTSKSLRPAAFRTAPGLTLPSSRSTRLRRPSKRPTSGIGRSRCTRSATRASSWPLTLAPTQSSTRSWSARSGSRRWFATPPPSRPNWRSPLPGTRRSCGRPSLPGVDDRQRDGCQ